MSEATSSSTQIGQHLIIRFCLESDATFGRGDGVIGLIDREVEHDADGLPFLRGRTLKGLLNEECANLLYALEQIVGYAETATWRNSAKRLFGAPGSDVLANAGLRFGDAQLPAAIRNTVHYELWDHVLPQSTERLQPTDILNSLTAIRRQTALDEMGVPVIGSLRSMRVILRQTQFEADVIYTARLQACDPPAAEPPTAEQWKAWQTDDLALLAAVVCTWRRAGAGRNRGRGKLKATLHNAQGDDITSAGLAHFEASLPVQKEEKP
ncbi:hypothetical protein BH10CHL1_BH10CHL1_32940 [soil metagenome]